MAGVKNSDIPDIFEFMGEMWAFMKSVWIPEDSTEYWENTACEAQKLLDKYRHDFCVAAVCFVLEYLKWRRRKDKGTTELDFNTWLHIDRANRGEWLKNQEKARRKMHESG